MLSIRSQRHKAVNFETFHYTNQPFYQSFGGLQLENVKCYLNRKALTLSDGHCTLEKKT